LIPRGRRSSVEPQPAKEEIDSIPPGSPWVVADQETYYYVDYNFYVGKAS